MKKYIKQIIGRFFKTAFLLSNRKIRIIFMYHRVIKEMPEEMHDPYLFVKESSFNMHIKEVSKYFQIVGLEDILRPEITEARLCAFTFDDGWLDNYEIAFPILLKNRSPATIFLPVIDIGTSRTF